MISDVLSDATVQIQRYLDQDDTYAGLILNDIKALQAHMITIRTRLDTPPDAREYTVPTLMAIYNHGDQ